MSGAREPEPWLFGRTWVHLFEEDSGAGSVYRPDEGDVPLSRRPRERIELKPDGGARLFLEAPDDRPRPTAATWTEEDGVLVVRPRSARWHLRIVEQAPDRLLVERRDDDG